MLLPFSNRKPPLDNPRAQKALEGLEQLLYAKGPACFAFLMKVIERDFVPPERVGYCQEICDEFAKIKAAQQRERIRFVASPELAAEMGTGAEIAHRRSKLGELKTVLSAEALENAIEVLGMLYFYHNWNAALLKEVMSRFNTSREAEVRELASDILKFQEHLELAIIQFRRIFPEVYQAKCEGNPQVIATQTPFEFHGRDILHWYQEEVPAWFTARAGAILQTEQGGFLPSFQESVKKRKAGKEHHKNVQLQPKEPKLFKMGALEAQESQEEHSRARRMFGH